MIKRIDNYSVVSAVEDFMLGQSDCENGQPERKQSAAYLRGYADQYEFEQNISALNVPKEISLPF